MAAGAGMAEVTCFHWFHRQRHRPTVDPLSIWVILGCGQLSGSARESPISDSRLDRCNFRWRTGISVELRRWVDAGAADEGHVAGLSFFAQ